MLQCYGFYHFKFIQPSVCTIADLVPNFPDFRSEGQWKIDYKNVSWRAIQKKKGTECNNPNDCSSELHHPMSQTRTSEISPNNSLEALCLLRKPVHWPIFHAFFHVLGWQSQTMFQPSLIASKKSVQWVRQSFCEREQTCSGSLYLCKRLSRRIRYFTPNFWITPKILLPHSTNKAKSKVLKNWKSSPIFWSQQSCFGIVDQ